MIEKKDTYNYDDIIKLGIDKSDYTIDIPLGINNTDYSIYNPFKLTKYYSIFSTLDFKEDDFENIVSQNNNILLDYKNISDNTIYLFTANNILNNLDDTFDKNLILKLYYPQLLEKNINNFDSYTSNNDTLITNTKEAITSKSFIKSNDNLTMLYEIYNKKSSDLPYIINGISKIQLTIYPRVSFKFPLDIVFKLLQTSENLPLIKYNPGNRKEKLYRLYSDKIATNGNKIPYLDKAKVFKMQKNIARTKNVSCLILADDNTEIICNFKEDGSINIEFSYFKIPVVSVSKIDEYIKIYVNPIIEIIKNFLEQSGYTFILYNNMNESNVEINDLSYFTNIPIKRKIKISEYIGCLNDVFNVYKDDLTKDIILRYKRVSNFNEMDSLEAFIVTQYTLKKSTSDIVSLIQQNFAISKDKAETKIRAFLNDVQVELDVNDSKKLKIRSNPGFEVIINKEQFTNNINIVVNNINNINYLKTIPIYIDTLLRISQKEPISIDSEFFKQHV